MHQHHITHLIIRHHRVRRLLTMSQCAKVNYNQRQMSRSEGSAAQHVTVRRSTTSHRTIRRNIVWSNL